MCKNLIHCSDHLQVVIVLSMGSAKKETNDKKGKRREKKKAQGETLKEVASIAKCPPFLMSSSSSLKLTFFRPLSSLLPFYC
jgi:hypothetical protein